MPHRNWVSIVLVGTLLFLHSCAPPNRNIGFPAFSPAGNVYAVIEIPAGTNHKLEYDKASGEFKVDQINGKDRVVQFLPYPGNYGFVPSTLMDTAKGGDGDALDILVLAAYVPPGTIMEVQPIGVLQLSDGGETDDKLIAIPVDVNQRTIPVETFSAFEQQFPAAQEIIKNWFLNYKGKGKMEFRGWADEQKALADIRKWAINTK
ncbi:MAG: inorganic diphosphatase [Bacteroidota bacterium]